MMPFAMDRKTVQQQEISKSNVVDDMVASNRLLYKEDEHPDHVVVIKCVRACVRACEPFVPRRCEARTKASGP